MTSAPFSPDRIVIGGDPSKWIVHDLIIDGRSQLRRRGMPGNELSHESPRSFAMGGKLDECPTGSDVAVDVSFTGSDPAGSAFVCGITGSWTSDEIRRASRFEHLPLSARPAR